MNELDSQVMSLSDQEVRAALMLLGAKHEADARSVIDSVLTVTRKVR